MRPSETDPESKGSDDSSQFFDDLSSINSEDDCSSNANDSNANAAPDRDAAITDDAREGNMDESLSPEKEEGQECTLIQDLSTSQVTVVVPHADPKDEPIESLPSSQDQYYGASGEHQDPVYYSYNEEGNASVTSLEAGYYYYPRNGSEYQGYTHPYFEADNSSSQSNVPIPSAPAYSDIKSGFFDTPNIADFLPIGDNLLTPLKKSDWPSTAWKPLHLGERSDAYNLDLTRIRGKRGPRGKESGNGGGCGGSSTSSVYEKRENACTRERSRMKQMNRAFDALRAKIPYRKPRGRKISKIEALRSAIRYIDDLHSYLMNNCPAASQSATQDGLHLQEPPPLHSMQQQSYAAMMASNGQYSVATAPAIPYDVFNQSSFEKAFSSSSLDPEPVPHTVDHQTPFPCFCSDGSDCSSSGTGRHRSSGNPSYDKPIFLNPEERHETRVVNGSHCEVNNNHNDCEAWNLSND